MVPHNRDDLLFTVELPDCHTYGGVEAVPDGDLRIVVVDEKRREYVQFLPFQDGLAAAIPTLWRIMGGIVEEYAERTKVDSANPGR